MAEEVVVSKEAVQRTERVTDTVRKEEVFVDEDADVDASIAEGSRDGSNPHDLDLVRLCKLNRVGVPWLLPSCSARALLFALGRRIPSSPHAIAPRTPADYR